MTRIALLAYGTRGDIQPMLVLATVLRARGHHVRMTVNEDQAEWAQHTGLDIVSTPIALDALIRDEESRRLLASGNMIAMFRRLRDAERASLDPIVDATLRAIEGAEIVLSTVLTMARGMAIAEARGIPHAVVLTVESAPTRAHTSVALPLRDTGSAHLNLLSHHLVYWLLWKTTEAPVHRLRKRLKLPPLRGARPRTEQVPSIGIYSDVLFPRPHDFAAQHQVVGLLTPSRALREQLGEGSAPEGLEAFLAHGSPPVFFGFGSMPVVDPQRLLREVALVTQRLGVRALVGAGWSDYGDAMTPPHVLLVRAFDHDSVLPRCRAAVHHGGAGTSTTVLRAGLPALVAHVNFDQPAWGARITKLGAGRSVPFRKLDAARLERELRALLDPAYLAAARRIAARLRAEDGLPGAVAAIERLAPSSSEAAAQ